MDSFIKLAKFFMAIIWAGLLGNLFFPFPGQAALVSYLLLGFISFIHLIQLLIIYWAVADKAKLSKSEALQVFIFGVFKLWQIKERVA